MPAAMLNDELMLRVGRIIRNTSAYLAGEMPQDEMLRLLNLEFDESNASHLVATIAVAAAVLASQISTSHQRSLDEVLTWLQKVTT